MDFQDPRGDLSPSALQSLISPLIFPDHRRSSVLTCSQPSPENQRRQPCYDWIFSSATNVHIAVDKSAFRTYTPFDSYLLAVADQRRVVAKGIGDVDLKIRCKVGSTDSRVVTLENVLHVPDWFCNIFSDVYFEPASDFEHKWTNFGIVFTKKQDHKFKAWGYTENFCGLEKVVLSRKLQGRSPMLEDEDREVWSINLHWPQHQRDKWEALVLQQMKNELAKAEGRMKAQNPSKMAETTFRPEGQRHSRRLSTQFNSAEIDPSKPCRSSESMTRASAKKINTRSLDLQRAGNRISLSEISNNIPVRREPNARISSLKATFSNRSMFRDIFPHGGKSPA